MIDIGAKMGRKVIALLTDMNQPLGNTVGNALEVAEAIEVLLGGAAADLTEVTMALGAELLVVGGKAKDENEGRAMLKRSIESGAALSKMREIIRWQQGDPLVLEDVSRLPHARNTCALPSPSAGFVSGIDAEAIGVAAMLLGAGRETAEGQIDPAVGVVLRRKVGDAVAAGESLAEIHYNKEERLEEVKSRILQAFRFSAAAPTANRLVLERLA